MSRVIPRLNEWCDFNDIITIIKVNGPTFFIRKIKNEWQTQRGQLQDQSELDSLLPSGLINGRGRGRECSQLSRRKQQEFLESLIFFCQPKHRSLNSVNQRRHAKESWGTVPPCGQNLVISDLWVVERKQKETSCAAAFTNTYTMVHYTENSSKQGRCPQERTVRSKLGRNPTPGKKQVGPGQKDPQSSACLLGNSGIFSNLMLLCE